MLKIFVTIDCNICGQPFDRIVVSTDRDPQAWKSLSQDLELDAERAGWSFKRAAHHCSYCITDVMLAGGQSTTGAEDESDDLPF